MMRETDQNGTAHAYNLTSATCTVDGLPHVDIPANYSTISIGVDGNLGMPGSETDQTYDLRVRQPIPIVLTGRDSDDDSRGWRRLACLAPNEVVEGSREPEGEFPPDSMAVGLRVQWPLMVPALVIARSLM